MTRPFTVLALLLLCTAMGTPAPAAPAPGLAVWAPGDPDPTIPFSHRFPVAIQVASEAEAREVVATGIDVEDVGRTGEVWIVRANVDEPGLLALSRPGREIIRLRNLSLEAHDAAMKDRAWPTWTELEASLQQIAGDHPSICRLISIGQSVQGRNIWFLKISDNPDLNEDEPEFKYTSSLHGDEVTGMELCRRLAGILTDNYATDPTLRSYVDGAEIWICPMSNPDGFVAASRYNAHGVDLNRDFPDPITDPVDSPAGREIETQHFMNFGYAHRFILSANYHGGALVVNYPWDCFAGYTPDDTMIENFSLGYAVLNPPMWNSPSFYHGVTIGWEWYIVNGGMQDWCYNWRGDIDVTIEVSNAKWPSWSLMDQFWTENRDAMLWYLARSFVGVRGIVTDAVSGLPLDATIDVVQIGKSIRTDPTIGDYHRMLEPGTYTVTCESPGYVSQQIAGVVVVDGPATRLDIALQPLASYTVSGTVTEEGTGAPLAGTVEARRAADGQLVASTPTDPGTGGYSLTLLNLTYDIRATAPGHAPVTRRVTLDQDRTEDFALALTANRILIVQDGAATRIAGDLAGLGNLTTVESSSLTDPASWAGYRMLVWSAGPAADPVADAACRAGLESYVAAGGTLLIEGGQIGYDAFRTPGYPSFGANVLHCSAWDVSSAGPISIATGQSGHSLVTTPNALPTQFAINYTEVGDQDAVRPLPNALLIYRTQAYPNDGGIIVYDDTPADPDRGQIVYYAFNYDRLTDTANAVRLLENTTAYLSRTDPAGVVEAPPALATLLGPAFPNPAHGMVRFAIDPRASSSARADVIDLQGRSVRSLALAGDRVALTWDGRTDAGRPAPTGIYFLKVRWRGEEAARRFLWIRP
jgi:carboxypeptidase D